MTLVLAAAGKNSKTAVEKGKKRICTSNQVKKVNDTVMNNSYCRGLESHIKYVVS